MHRYLSQDPIGLDGGLNYYAYPLNPVQWVDLNGLAACTVSYPDYPIEYSEGKTSTRLGGHGGVLGYDSKGANQYYKYGRYRPGGKGIIGVSLPAEDSNVRKVGVPNLKIGKDGKPTPESMESLKAALSQNSGKGTPAQLTCNDKADEKKVYEHVDAIAKDKDREKYNWSPFSPNHCRSFAKNAVKAGG